MSEDNKTAEAENLSDGIQKKNEELHKLIADKDRQLTEIGTKLSTMEQRLNELHSRPSADYSNSSNDSRSKRIVDKLSEGDADGAVKELDLAKTEILNSTLNLVHQANQIERVIEKEVNSLEGLNLFSDEIKFLVSDYIRNGYDPMKSIEMSVSKYKDKLGKILPKKDQTQQAMDDKNEVALIGAQGFTGHNSPKQIKVEIENYDTYMSRRLNDRSKRIV